MNRQRTHRTVRARRRRNGRIVLLCALSWVVVVLLWPVVGIAMLAGWLILEAIGA